MEFTQRQLDAIDISKAGQDTCVMAGPGSGKTRVLVEYYRRLVVDGGVPPQRILAITFTEKAARNMKEKLAESFRGMPEQRRQLEQANVSTIHGFCARLLRENSVFAGIDPAFRVLDARQATIMQRQAASDSLDRMFAEQPDAMRRLIESLACLNLAGEMPDIYDAMRSAGVAAGDLRGFQMRGAGLEDLRAAVRGVGPVNTFGWTSAQIERLQEVQEAAQRLTELPDGPATAESLRVIDEFPTSLNPLKRSTATYSRLKTIKDDIVPDIYRTLLTGYFREEREALISGIEAFDRLYSERKRQMGVLDYADLEAFTVRLLEENKDVRDRIQHEFQHVLMDEFQDTNGQQSKLVNLLRGHDRFYAVGDINQSIYGFRHADPEVFRGYRDAVERDGKHLVELVENWRSRNAILRAVETILDRADGIEHRKLVAAKEFPEKLEAPVEILAGIAATQDEALDLEAKLVARRIVELTESLHLENGSLAGFGDIAVLVRNSEVLPAFTRAFEQAGIPYLLNQGKGFFDTREVVDLTQLLRVIANPRDEISLAGVLRSPFFGLSDEALLRLKLGGGSPENLGSAVRKLEHLEAGFTAADLEKLRRFREQLTRWRETRDLAGFDRLLMRAMDETGYSAHPGTRAAANIEKFLAMAREASSRITLADFVEELELMRDADARDADAPPEDAVHAVRIMTVHAAKGLEFPVVFLAAIHKGIQQGVGQVCFSPRVGLGARWMVPDSEDDKGDWFHAAIREEAGKREIQEGNRLFYVAMTRAQEHLIFSFSIFAKRKEWAAKVEAAFGLDLSVPQQKVELIEAPDGDRFPLRILSANAPPPLRSRLAADSTPALVQTVARPRIRDQYDSSASVTSIALFADCPRRYYLERYLGWQGHNPRHLRVADWEEPANDIDADIDATDFGSEVHKLLAGKMLGEPTTEARKLFETFQTSTLGRRVARASRVEREFDFLMAVEDIVLRGQIDLWFEEAGELVLVDYKTDDVKAREAAARAEFYASQLRLYALALERITGRFPNQAIVYFLRPASAVPITLERTLLDDPETLVREFREAQSGMKFPLREGEHCLRCPYFRGLCPAGSSMPDVVHPAAINGENLAGNEAGLY